MSTWIEDDPGVSEVSTKCHDDRTKAVLDDLLTQTQATREHITCQCRAAVVVNMSFPSLCTTAYTVLHVVLVQQQTVQQVQTGPWDSMR